MCTCDNKAALTENTGRVDKEKKSVQYKNYGSMEIIQSIGSEYACKHSWCLSHRRILEHRFPYLFLSEYNIFFLLTCTAQSLRFFRVSFGSSFFRVVLYPALFGCLHVSLFIIDSVLLVVSVYYTWRYAHINSKRSASIPKKALMLVSCSRIAWKHE